MSDKMIVTFKELPVLSCAMDYLSYCKHCGTYGLGERPCAKCEKTDNVSIDHIAEKTVQKNLMTRIGVSVIVYAVMYLLSMDFMQILLSTLFCAGLVVGQIMVYKKYKTELVAREMREHIHANIDKIREDLKSQLTAAIKEVDQNDLVAAYDRLRYLGKLMDNEKVRTFKLICLKNFDIRSDMPLEMNTLLQPDCNSYLIDYIYEVAKVRKDLIDEQTILYIVEYKEQVLAKSKGKQIMASVLEAALRSKYLLARYAKYMLGYVKYFSRQRQLRLCKLSHCIEDELVREALLQEVREAVGSDEAFAPYLEV